MVSRQWLLERPPPPEPGAIAPQAPATDEPCVDPLSLPAGSLRARALDAVTRIGEPLQLAVILAPADRSQLSMRLADRQGAALTLFIERVRSDGTYYQRGGRLGLWHGRDNPPWAVPVLKAVAKLLLSPAFDGLADELPLRPSSPPVAAGAPVAAERIEAGRANGTSIAALGEPVPPLDPKRPYARLRVLGATDVERFFHVDYEFDSGEENVEQPPTCRIGIIYQCNQPCTFCQLAEMNVHIPPARIYAALDASWARGARRVILTGGEPTLCRHLVDYVRYANHQGFSTIELQTNATLLDDPDLVARLRQAGLTDAQVSLHGPDAEISDRLTAAPGTHRRTLAGVTNLLDAGVRVLLNHLVFRDNCHLLVEFVEMVERRWGRHRQRLILQFHSPLNEFARPEFARKHIARYSEYASLLRRAIDRACELKYPMKSFQDHLQDPTGIPALCVLAGDSDYLGPILSQRVKPRFHRWESEWLTRVTACKSCEIADACMGVPKGYVELYGEDEFHPVRLNGKS